MKIDLELSPIFQSLAKAPLLSIQLEESEATVQGMLSSLSKEYGEGMTNLLFEKGQNAILSGLMVTVNDKIYTGTALNRQRVQLHGGDKVSLLYFVSGG